MKWLVFLFVFFFFLITDDLLANKARPPPEEEFIDIFQKFKYCFTLLVGVQFDLSYILLYMRRMTVIQCRHSLFFLHHRHV